jgi:hypothetical protein
MIGDLDESTMNILVGMGWTFFLDKSVHKMCNSLSIY